MMLALQSGVSAAGVAAYKAMSDENRLVSEILADGFADMIADSIVDVGCGLGDIAAAVWPERDVLLLDILRYPDNCDAAGHERIQADFFDSAWSRGRLFSTALLAHVLQYLDSPLEALYARLAELRPQTLITVTDIYDQQFSEIVEWTVEELGSINPEHPTYVFPAYTLDRERQFAGNLAADSFPRLASLLAEVILDRHLYAEEEAAFSDFLASRLDSPSITLKQAVRGYRRVG